MKSEPSLSAEGSQRRRLFTGWVTRARQAEMAPTPPSARLPQALPEALFCAACNGCGDCSDACPYGLLTVQQGKAVLNVEFTECDHCLKCTSACQTGALRAGMPSDTTLRPQISASCLGLRDGCRMCVISCPQRALSFNQTANAEAQWQCDDRQCNGCGLCKLSCCHGHIVLVPTGEKPLPPRL